MTAAGPRTSARGGAELVRHPSERWNPILVKEVRQALRGRVFRIVFMVTLFAALFAGLANLGDPSELASSSGQQASREYFMSLYVCLTVALLVVVPFSAFQAMGNEWEENTFELLSLSQLRPRRIVVGKLWSAAVQALLFASVFVPFLSIGALQPGLDLYAGGLALAVAGIACAFVTLVAVSLSTLSRHRFVRILLLLGLGWLGVPLLVGINSFCAAALRDPREFSSNEAFLAMGWAAALAAIGAAYLLALACNMLAHPEENRSTNVRVVTTLGSLAMMAFTTWVAASLGSTEVVSFMAVGGLAVVSAVGFLFTTERRELGRRVTLHVPRSPMLALLASPWLPGGGRGALLHCLHVGLIGLWGFALVSSRRGSTLDPLDDGIGALLVSALLSVFYVLFLPGVLARFAQRPSSRLALRIGVPIFVGLSILVPGIVGAVIGSGRLQNLRHPANPFWIIERAWNQNGQVPGFYLLGAGLALVALLVNTPRVVAGLTEVLAAATALNAADRRTAGSEETQHADSHA